MLRERPSISQIYSFIFNNHINTKFWLSWMSVENRSLPGHISTTQLPPSMWHNSLSQSYSFTDVSEWRWKKCKNAFYKLVHYHAVICTKNAFAMKSKSPLRPITIPSDNEPKWPSQTLIKQSIHWFGSSQSNTEVLFQSSVTVLTWVNTS